MFKYVIFYIDSNCSHESKIQNVVQKTNFLDKVIPASSSALGSALSVSTHSNDSCHVSCAAQTLTKLHYSVLAA